MMKLLVIAVLILFSEVSHEVPALGKEEVAHASTEGDGQEEPAIVGHGYQHEEIGVPHLCHVES